MNIKSLILGSAAASLVAASGAQAADPIIYADPEPMEYVRICDVYGTGYFYIPGTETCLRIHGWVRYETFASTTDNGWWKTARGRLEITTKNASDWGDVEGYIRLDSRLVNGWGRNRPLVGTVMVDTTGDGTPDTAVAIAGETGWNRDNRWDAQYSLGIGGLHMGFRDSQWVRFSGYGGLTDWGGNYGFQERHFISYTFTADAFSAIISLEHDNAFNYMPDIVAGVSGKFGDVSASLSAAYDESLDAFNVKGTVNAPIGPATLRVVGLYRSAPNAYQPNAGAGAGGWRGTNRWSAIVGVSAPITQATGAAVDVQYFQGGDWLIIGNLTHQIAPGLSALLEVSHSRNRFAPDRTTGMLRFQRSF